MFFISNKPQLSKSNWNAKRPLYQALQERQSCLLFGPTLLFFKLTSFSYVFFQRWKIQSTRNQFFRKFWKIIEFNQLAVWGTSSANWAARDCQMSRSSNWVAADNHSSQLQLMIAYAKIEGLNTQCHRIKLHPKKRCAKKIKIFFE